MTNREVAVKMYKAGLGDSEWEPSVRHFEETIKTMQRLNEMTLDTAYASEAEAVSEPRSPGSGSPKNRVLSKTAPFGSSFDSKKEKRRTSFTTRLLEDDCAKRQPCRPREDSGSGPGSGPVSEPTSPVSFASAKSSMDLSRCFVQLIAHSEQANAPGMDIETEKLWVVFELGAESLEERLARRADEGEGKTLSIDELRQIQWALVSIVCGLHAAGFVHLDIKPSNVVRFGRAWKLIDFDGAVRTGTTLPSKRLCSTPCYMAPEAARHWLQDSSQVQVSRLMDVWSVGMCAIETIFLQPVMRPFYIQWGTETGDDNKFLKWLADGEEAVMDTEMCEAINDFHPDMCDLLQGMLEKDPAKRMDITECVVHPWFEPIRSQMWMGFALDTPASSGSTRAHDLTPRSSASDCSGSSDGVGLVRLASSNSFRLSESERAVKVSRACALM